MLHATPTPEAAASTVSGPLALFVGVLLATVLLGLVVGWAR
jgi:hypothetical protein